MELIKVKRRIKIKQGQDRKDKRLILELKEIIKTIESKITKLKFSHEQELIEDLKYNEEELKKRLQILIERNQTRDKEKDNAIKNKEEL